MVTGISKCKKCGNEFKWRICSYEPEPKHCSSKCKFKYKTATYEEKLERVKFYYEKNVIKKEGCWDWKGPIDHYGYGKTTTKTGIGFNTAHKTSWILHKGKIPEGKIVCHSCDNRLCSNPDHLWLGTHKQNTHDMIKKGRLKSGIWNQFGSKNPIRKLNEDQVMQIKNLLSQGRTGAEIARLFKVSSNVIYDIKSERTWKQVRNEK